MPEHSRLKGRCLCGAVTITIPSDHTEVHACHCHMCQRWGGASSMALDVGQDIGIDGADNVTVYRSSDWAERGFCKVCGSSLYYRLVDAGSYSICTGILEDQDSLTLNSQYFIDEKPAYYDFANDTEKLTGDEVFARFAPQEE